MMSRRLVAHTLSLFFAALLATPAAVTQNRSPGETPFHDDPLSRLGDNSSSGRITGTVRTFDGHAVNNANIQVRDLVRGGRVISAQTDASGSFALYNISPGSYEITATSGVDEAQAHVQLNSTAGETDVDLRLRNKAGSESLASGATVSLSQFKVPPKARALYEKASQAMGRGKLDEARSKVDAALAISPSFAEALTLRGILQSNAGKINEAINDFQQAIHADANFALAYLAMAATFNSHGRFDESLPVLSQAERLAPNAWQTYFELSRAKIGKGDFTTALHDIDHASALLGGPKKELPELHLVRGYALIGLTEIPRAVQELEMFLAREPNGPVADRTRKVLDQLRASTITEVR